MGMTALVWLANELSVSQDSYDRLLLLAGELPKLKREISSFPGFLEAPWFLIFDLLGWKNLSNSQDEPIVPQDRKAFSVLAQCYRIPEINGIVSPAGPVQYMTDASDDGYWSQYFDVTGGLWSPEPSSSRPNSLFLLLRDIPLPSTDTLNEIVLTIQLSRWRNSPQMLVKPSDDLDPRIPPSIPDTGSVDESIVNLGIYPKADGLPSWFSSDDDALYIITMRRMISILGAKGTIPPAFLDALRWRFEVQLAGADRIDESTCLSMPVHYRDALSTSSLTVPSIHYAFTLLLARNLSVFAGDELVFRVKEILTMMWVSPVYRWSHGAIVDRVGMESFFDANKPTVMEWIAGSEDITYIYEILRHLRMAQAMEPRIGSLWRVTPPQEDNEDALYYTITTLDHLVRGVTPEQHYEIIDLVCQDLALDAQDALEAYFKARFIGTINRLEDRCLRLLIQSCLGAVGDSFYLSPSDIDAPWKESWARVATYFMRHPEGTKSPFILGLQGSLWPVFPNQSEFCSRALEDPELFTRLQHMFEHHVACQLHHNIEGHLLLHILNEHVECTVDADLTAYTGIPMTGRHINLELVLMILPDERYIIQPECLTSSIHTECLEKILEIGKVVMSSQLSALSALSEIPARLLTEDNIGSEELAAISIGVVRALDLPRDPRVALIIPGLVSGIQKIKGRMYFHGDRSEWENQTADEEATIASNRLMTHLACMKIFGGQNVRMMFCSRTQDSHSPAVGWLAMHTE